MTGVHTRKTLAIGALTLLLAACGGQEAGPKPQGGGQTASTDVLGIKLDALTADQCYRSPTSQVPRGCAKYITELGSTVGTVRAAGLVGYADDLSKGIDAYRASNCESVSTPGNPCSQTLSDIAATLTRIKQKVDQWTSGR
ncbi:hypothetical protein [Amycolatopsis taiwanensis]|uniref:DUF732 domain-containing protein n=1 Tax=Amycolatopsis taiwanensis TaxID=342230 RepID=A0A9W6R6A9_9PSEU|nr:hypothetical protein [Amycolatopsis taiwanensis]GLY68337.1 hypothetical protein Atai01_49560 [Amycolatopsis taiwanensis]